MMIVDADIPFAFRVILEQFPIGKKAIEMENFRHAAAGCKAKITLFAALFMSHTAQSH
jgi:hypothetical protein